MRMIAWFNRQPRWLQVVILVIPVATPLVPSMVGDGWLELPLWLRFAILSPVLVVIGPVFWAWSLHLFEEGREIRKDRKK